ncbi:hypothetical protein V2J09_007007, partial [Rumex salicifolius]
VSPSFFPDFADFFFLTRFYVYLIICSLNYDLIRKSKLYRFDKDGNQWKERGAGSVKLLKHKVTGKVRLVMRQSKTLKICANHLILSSMTVQEHAGNEKSCLWHAADFSDGELKDELFSIRFASVEKVLKTEGRVGQTTNVVIGGTVTDDSTDEWLTLDQKPKLNRRRIGFTAIETGGDDFVQSMIVAIESVLQQPIPEVCQVKPDVLLGLSAVGAECTPEEAFSIFGDHIIFASGSPFDNVDLGFGSYDGE